jgi:hypothetical protein
MSLFQDHLFERVGRILTKNPHCCCESNAMADNKNTRLDARFQIVKEIVDPANRHIGVFFVRESSVAFLCVPSRKYGLESVDVDRFLLRCAIKFAQSNFNETVGWYGCDSPGLDHEVGCFSAWLRPSSDSGQFPSEEAKTWATLAWLSPCRSR